MSVVGFREVMTFLPLPVGASLAGSGVAVLFRPARTLEGAIQHFAAGAVLAGVAVELVPELRGRGGVAIAIGWALGLLAMLLLRRLVTGLEAAAGDESLSLIYVALVDIFIDGFLFSIGFGAGRRAGIILAIALSIEALFLALTISAASRGRSRRRRALTPLGLAALLATGATAGALLLSAIGGTVLTLLLAGGTVALLYLVVEELLTEAHETVDTEFGISMFFAAFLLILLLETSV